MNKSYKSVWNESLGAYVAVAEGVSAGARKSSGTRKARRAPARAHVSQMPLEQRIVFDAALPATVVDVQSEASSSPAQAVDLSASDTEDAAVEVAPPAVASTTGGQGGRSEPGEQSTQALTEADAEQGAASNADQSADIASADADGSSTNLLSEDGVEADGEGADAQAADSELDPTASGALDADESSDEDGVAEETEIVVDSPRREIIFVDPVASSLSPYLQDRDAEIIYLNASSDGVQQIAAALQGRTDVSAIHIVSHGVEGRLMLGSTVLDLSSMQGQHREALESIGLALTEDADILIYGCNFTAGENGLAAAQMLADITGADIAASSDTTGHAERDGNWVLETSIGQIETVALSPTAWMGQLDLLISNVGVNGAAGVGATGASVNNLASAIMGPGVTINSATYYGGGTQAGTFQTGAGVSFGSNILEFTDGAIFTTHTTTTSVGGPNNSGGFSADAPNGIDGDPDFLALNPGLSSHDASFIVIEFTPDVFPGMVAGEVGRMTASIVFGSEEYNEYVYSQVNDSIGLWINGTNVALAPNGLPIGIDTINNAGVTPPAHGSPTNNPNPGADPGVYSSANPTLYVDNTGGAYNTQMDGFTVTLTLTFDVIVGQTNTIKLGIADTGDAALDSWLFVKAESLQTHFVAENDTVIIPSNHPQTVDVTANDFNLGGGDLTVTAINGSPINPGDTVTLSSGITVTMTPEGTLTVFGSDTVNPPSDSFTYTVQNEDGLTTNATVTVHITGANQNPNAVDDSYSVSEDAGSAVVGNALANDTDPDPSTHDDNPLVAVPQTLVPGSNGGLFTVAADGTVTFDPNGEFGAMGAGDSTTTTLTYTVNDGFGGTDTATITVTVTGVNDAPVLVPGSPLADQSGDDGDTITPVDVSGAFTDPDAGDVLTYTADNLPPGLTLDPGTGIISGTLTPAASQGGNPGTPGVYTVTVTATDSGGESVDTTFTYTVGNPPPVAENDGFSYTDGAPVGSVGNALTNDNDPDGDTLIVTEVNGVAGNVGTPIAGTDGGLFTVAADGTVTFDPNGDFTALAAGVTATTTVTYTVSDGQGGLDTATITVTVTGVNDAPVVVPGSPLADQSGDDGDTITPLDVSGSFTDPEGDTLTYTADNLPPGLTLDPNTGIISGTLTSDASQGGDPGTPGTYTVTVTAEDPDGETVSTTFTYTVGNPPPVAENDGFSYTDGAPVGSVGNALTNDSDPDGDTLVVTEVNGVAGNVGTPIAGTDGGLFTVAADGTVTFDPNGDFTALAAGETATTTVTYTVSDGQGGLDTATITVTVTGVNDAPVLVPGSPLADQSGDDGDTITPVDVSGAFSDPDASDVLSYTADNLPPGLTLDPNTGIISGTLTSDASQGGDDPVGAPGVYTVTVTAEDPDGETVSTTFTYTVGNPPPVATDDGFAAGENSPPGVVGNALDNDNDPDGDMLTVVEVGGDAANVGTAIAGSGGGLFTVAADGTVTFDPNGEFTALAAGVTATTSVTYLVSDGQGGTSSATITVTVTGANDVPVLVPGSPVVDQSGDDGDTITPVDVSGSFTDPDGDPLTYTADNLPPGLTLDPNTGIISGTLTPDASQGGDPGTPGTYTVTVTATDPWGSSVDLTFTYTVSNPPPVANDDVVTTDEDTPVTIDVLANDSDPDGDPLTVTTATAGNGTVVINPDGTITYTPNPDFNGTDTITYTISDGNGGTATATVTVTVNPVNDPPVAVDDIVPTRPNAPTVGNVLTNDSDPEGDPLSVVSFEVGGVTYPAGGTANIPGVGSIAIQPDGSFVFTPRPGYSGPVPAVTYTVTDGDLSSSAQLVLGDVPRTPVAPPPGPPVTPPAPPAGPPVSPPVPPAPPEWGGPPAPAPAPAPVSGPLPVAPFQPYPGGGSGSDRFPGDSSYGAFQPDATLRGDVAGQLPDGQLLSVNSADTPALRRELAPGELRAMEHALHVQHAVRHEPVTTDHGLFVQRVVRGSQVESAVRNAVVDAALSAAPGATSLFDPFALGAPKPGPAEAEPRSEQESAPPSKPVKGAQAEEPVSDTRAELPATVEGQDTPAVEEPPARALGAQGFRAQLQRLATDRNVGTRPLARDVHTA